MRIPPTTSPLWIAALVVLLINDHALKAMAPGLVTGKLSDVAGLIVAPLALASLARVRSERGLMGCVALVWGVFAAINLSATLAMRWDALLGSVGVPFSTTCDPSDLLAMLLAAPLLWVSCGRGERVAAPSRAWALVASLACLASSPDEPSLPYPESARVTILNKSNELHQLSLYKPRSTLLFSPERTAEGREALTLEHFDLERPDAIISLFSGQEIGLSDVLGWHSDIYTGSYITRDDNLWLVRSPALPDIIVSWQGLADKTYYFDVEVPQEVPADRNTVVIDADYTSAEAETLHPWRYAPCEDGALSCDPLSLDEARRIPVGTRYTWRSVAGNRLHRLLPSIPPSARCEVTPSGAFIDWDVRSGDSWQVMGVSSGLDGCSQITVQDTGDDTKRALWTLCAPANLLTPLEPVEGERVLVRTVTSAGASLVLEIRHVTSGDLALRAHKLTLLREASALPLTGTRVGVFELLGCPASATRCQASLPGDFWIVDETHYTVPVGGQVVLPTRRATFALAGAGIRAMQDLSCNLSSEPFWFDGALLEETTP
jgi:hypothetical protein